MIRNLNDKTCPSCGQEIDVRLFLDGRFVIDVVGSHNSVLVKFVNEPNFIACGKCQGVWVNGEGLFTVEWFCVRSPLGWR